MWLWERFRRLVAPGKGMTDGEDDKKKPRLLPEAKPTANSRAAYFREYRKRKNAAPALGGNTELKRTSHG